MQKIILRGRWIVEGHRRGKALVSARPLSFLGGVDPKNGVVVDKTHDLFGRRVKDTILCFPHGHGSTVGSYVLYSLAKRKLAPSALVNETADPVIVVGAIIADIPMVDKVDIRQISSGDVVEVDADKGIVTVFKRGES